MYLPCALIVVLSWVGFWLNREATSDRVTLGVTAVLTLSAISMDSRSDLPKVLERGGNTLNISIYTSVSETLHKIRKCFHFSTPSYCQVHYATALDWFIICSFLYCLASILEFAGVHYFTKVRGH